MNADSQINDTLLGTNLFAYCENNPVNMVDYDGHWPDWNKLKSGNDRLMLGVMAIYVSVTVLTCGAAGPALIALSVITLAAGATSAVIGVAEIVESFSGNNFVRDEILQGDTQTYEIIKEVSSTTAEIGSITLGVAIFAAGGVCFVAGTDVLTSDGKKDIETIKAGDLVWAENPETGEKALKKVVQTFKNQTSELVHVFVNGEEIVTTPEHPFYVPNKGWMGAIHLRAGEILVLSNGKFATVEKIQHEILESPINVYNFEVEDFHTYFVGENSVLVHNVCKLQPDPNATGAHSTFKKGPNGKITNYAEWTPNPKNPSGFDLVKRVDIFGKAHNGIPAPHVHGSNIPGGARPAYWWEIPE